MFSGYLGFVEVGQFLNLSHVRCIINNSSFKKIALSVEKWEQAFFRMFCIFLILTILALPLNVAAGPRSFKYNCLSMEAELFPIKETGREFGQKSYKLTGKLLDKVMENLPAYDRKIKEETERTAASVPTDFDEANNEFIRLRSVMFARDSTDNFTQSADDSFKEKMKILQLYNLLGERVINSFNFLMVETPYDWLDRNYALYFNFINMGIKANFVKANRRRLQKRISVTQDPCYLLAQSLQSDRAWSSGAAKNAYELVYKCYDVFPFDKNAATAIFDTCLLMLDFYVFTNFTSNGLGAKNVFRTLEEQQLVFDSNLRFHEFIATTLNNMNDAHISYRANCYEQFTFIQPLFFQHLVSPDMGGWGLYITKTNLPELQPWLNSKVIKIDGLDGPTVVSLYANGLGKSHNINTRYTLGISRLFYDSSGQDFRLDRGFYLKRSSIPYRPYLIYALRKPGSFNLFEIKVDWLVFKNPTLKNFGTKYSYWNNNCQAQPFTRIPAKDTTLQRRDPGALQSLPKRTKLKKRVMEPLEKRGDTLQQNSDGTTPISVGPGFAFFILKHPDQGEFAVLIIQTFDVTDMDSWFKNMRKGFLALINNGIKRLLLDLTGNSGGVLCLAYSLLGVLSPSSQFPYPATKYSYGTRATPSKSLIRISKCVDEAAVKISPFKMQCFLNQTSHAEFTDSVDWESQGDIKPKIVNGIISGYTKFSPFLMDKCVLKQSSQLADVKPGLELVTVVTDGLCGSSCAIVAIYLHQNGSPGLLLSSYRNGLNHFPNIYSFAGGQVVNINNIRDIAKRSSCYDMIPNTLESVQVTVTYRGIFNLADKRNPLEYYIIPANFNFEYADKYANSFKARWMDFFAKGVEISENIQDFTWDSSESGNVMAYSM